MLCTLYLIRCDREQKRKFPSLKSQAWSPGEEEEEGLKWLLGYVIVSAHWLLLLEPSLPYLAKGSTLFICDDANQQIICEISFQ